MAPTFEQYIDTDIDTLIVTVNHNLDGFPYITFLRIVDPITNKQVYMSLYDPLITEIEPINRNQTKITFSSSYKGYFRAFIGDKEDIVGRLMDVEKNIDFIYEQLEKRVTNNQLQQMNTLHEQQLETLNTKIEDLDVRLESLDNKVDSL